MDAGMDQSYELARDLTDKVYKEFGQLNDISGLLKATEKDCVNNLNRIRGEIDTRNYNKGQSEDDLRDEYLGR